MNCRKQKAQRDGWALLAEKPQSNVKTIDSNRYCQARFEHFVFNYFDISQSSNIGVLTTSPLPVQITFTVAPFFRVAITGVSDLSNLN